MRLVGPWLAMFILVMTLVVAAMLGRSNVSAQDSDPHEQLLLLRRIASAEDRQARALEDIAEAVRHLR